MAGAPKVCTPNDPTGNGTQGRVYTQSVSAYDPEAAKRAEQQRAKANACLRQPGVCALLDLASRVPWASAKAGVQVGPAKVSVDSKDGLQGGLTATKPSLKVSAEAEVCIKLPEATKDYIGEKFCLGIQSPVKLRTE